MKAEPSPSYPGDTPTASHQVAGRSPAFVAAGAWQYPPWPDMPPCRHECTTGNPRQAAGKAARTNSAVMGAGRAVRAVGTRPTHKGDVHSLYSSCGLLGGPGAGFAASSPPARGIVRLARSGIAVTP